MQRAIPIGLALSFAVACTPKDDGGYGGSGSTYYGAEDTAGTPGVDTAAGDSGTDGATTEDGWPLPEDEGGPSQRNPECGFDDFPNIGEVIYCLVEVRGGQSDILGGQLLISLYDITTDERLAFEDADALKISDFESDAACLICLDGDELSFAIVGIEDSHNYEMTWSITDRAGKRSNELELLVP